MQRPFLFLSGREAVAEGFPRELKALVGQGFAQLCGVAVEFAFAHPRAGEQRPVAVCVFVGELARGDGVALVDDATFEHLVAADERIDDVLIFVRRTHLHDNRTTVGGEFLGSGIEPVVGLHGGMFIFQAEDDERLLHGVLATNGFERVSARFQRVEAHFERLVGRDGLRVFVFLFLILDLIRNLACDGLSGVVQIVEFHARHAVGLHLRGHFNAERRRFVAQGQRRFAVVRLAGSVGGIGLHDEVVESGNLSLLPAPSGFIHQHRHLHLETAFVVRHERVTDDGSIGLVAAAPPPHCTTAHHIVFHTRALHGHAREATHTTHHRHCVAFLVFFGHFVKLHLESRTLVFLDREIHRRILRRDAELARKPRRGQHEVGRCLSEFIGPHLLFLHHLVVGIAQRERELLARHHRRFLVGLDLVGHHRHADGLPGAIDAAVGEEIVGILRGFVVVEREAPSKPLLGAGFVLVGIDVEAVGLSLRVFVFHFALGVGGQRLHVVFALIAVVFRAEADFRTCDGLACRGIHGHEPHAIVGQGFVNHVEVAHVQQHSLGAHIGAVGRKFHEIHAHGQSLDGHRILEKLIFGLAEVASRHRLLCAVADDEFLQSGVVLVVRGVQLGVAREVEARDGHRESLTIHQLSHFHAPRRVRQLDSVANRHRERRQRQMVLCVAQNVHPRPCAPVLQGVVDVVHLLLGGGVLGLVHKLIARDGQLATFLQVLIFGDERVQSQQVFRLPNGRGVI